MKYSCGCINETDSDSGVLHCIKKCEFHIRWSVTHSQGESIEYFKEIGCIDAQGIPNNLILIQELRDGLSLQDEYYLCVGHDKTLLELGCGLGPYVSYFLAGKWSYEAVERGFFAFHWVKKTFYVPIVNGSVEEYLSSRAGFHCIFAAHLFEHLENMPKVLRQCFDRVTERLYLIVPDDGDPTNPDHYWFFTQETLKALLEKIGFARVRMQMRKRVPQENFIYCVAEKP